METNHHDGLLDDSVAGAGDRSRAMNQHHKCSVCGRSSIRLYREYGNFLRDAEIQCKEHTRDGEPGKWMVPLVEDDDGTVWGYTSTPIEDWERWDGLPEGTWITTKRAGVLLLPTIILALMIITKLGAVL